MQFAIKNIKESANGISGAVQFDLTENGDIIAHVTKKSWAGGFCHEFEAKFFSERAKVRFMPEYITIAEALETMYLSASPVEKAKIKAHFVGHDAEGFAKHTNVKL